jgi:hypothetical protein
MTVKVELSRDLEVKVQKFANGVGVEVSELIERAVIYALSSLYPDQGLPGSQPKPDQGLPGSQPKPDQGLPGEQPEIDNELPRPPFNPTIDNELPEGEIPVDPEYGIDADRGEGDYPSQGQGLNPNLNPDVDPNLDRRKQPKS